jgi:hypothetical protein
MREWIEVMACRFASNQDLGLARHSISSFPAIIKIHATFGTAKDERTVYGCAHATSWRFSDPIAIGSELHRTFSMIILTMGMFPKMLTG